MLVGVRVNYDSQNRIVDTHSFPTDSDEEQRWIYPLTRILTEPITRNRWAA